MAADQNIGGVNVTIGADYSQLEQDFNTTQQIAAEAGQKVAEGFTSGAAGADTLSQATTTAVESLGSFDVATQSFIRFRTEAEAIDKEWADALVENAERARQAAEEPISGFEKFADSIAEFIEHPLESASAGAKSFITALGPVGVVALAAGAALFELGHIITELVLEEGQAARATENLALRLNLTWEEAKHLSDVAKLVDVDMGALTRTSMRLADAMEDPTGSGKKVAQALEGMGSAALYSDKPILTLLEDLAKIPEAAERISAAHQIMGRGAVALEPMLADYEKLNELVDSLGGKLQKEAIDKLLETDKQAKALGISWDHFKESLAVTFSPAIMYGLEKLTSILTVGAELPITAQVKVLEQELENLRKQREKMATGTLLGTGAIFGESFDTIDASIAKKREQIAVLEAQKDAEDNLAASKRQEASAGALQAQEEAAAAEAAKRNYERMKIVIDQATANQIALITLDREGLKAKEALGQSSASEDVALLKSLNQQEYDIVAEGINRKIALEKSKREEEKDLTLGAQLDTARRKKAEEDQKLDEQVTAQRKKEIDKQVADEVDGQNRELAAEKQAMDVSGKLYQELNLAVEKGQVLQEQNKLKHIDAQLETERAVGAAELSAHQITVFAKMAIDDQINAAEAAAQQTSLAREIAALDAEDTLEASKVAKRIALIAQQQALEDKLDRTKQITAIQNEDAAWKVLGLTSSAALQTQIDEASQAVDMLKAEGAPLGAIQAGQQHIIDLMIRQKQEAGGLTTVYGNLLSGVQHAFSGVGSSIASMAMAGKSAGEILTTTLKNIATSAIGAVIQGFVNMGTRMVLTAVLGTAQNTAYTNAALAGITKVAAAEKAAAAASIATASTVATAKDSLLAMGAASQAAVDSGIVASQASVGFAAQFADVLLAVPYPANLVTAPLAAAAASAEIMAGGAAAGFDRGGMVPEDMTAMVHKGEYISTTNDTARALAGGGSAGLTLNFAGMNVYGTPGPQFIKSVMTEVVRQIRLPLGMKVNF